jgi:hypothetical protein
MPRKTFHSGGPNAEDKALEVWSDVIIDKLEHLSKDTKWEQPWFDKEGLAWPKNMSGRQYSGMNAVILKMLAEKNHYQLPIWGTFNRLTSLNYEKDGNKIVPAHDKDGNDLPRVMVNKGEKSTPVGLTVFTVINKETKEKIPYEAYRELDPEQQQEYNVYPKLTMYNVFNLSQTNLKEARPELYEKLKAMYDQEEPQKDRKMWALPEFDAMLDEQKWICPIDIKDEGSATTASTETASRWCRRRSSRMVKPSTRTASMKCPILRQALRIASIQRTLGRTNTLPRSYMRSSLQHLLQASMEQREISKPTRCPM